MLETCDAWIEGSQAEHLEAIKRAMAASHDYSASTGTPKLSFQHAEFGTGLPLTG
jgi:hypothetical protein